MQKDKEKSKGNITEDRQRMKVEESQEGKYKTKKEIEAERKIGWKQRKSEEKDRRQQERIYKTDKERDKKIKIK